MIPLEYFWFVFYLIPVKVILITFLEKMYGTHLIIALMKFITS